MSLAGQEWITLDQIPSESGRSGHTTPNGYRDLGWLAVVKTFAGEVVWEGGPYATEDMAYSAAYAHAYGGPITLHGLNPGTRREDTST